MSGSTAEEERNNIWCARAYMLYARTMLGYLARAPHAYLPMLLCDHVAAERALALQFGLQLLEQSEVLLICGDRISRGMKGEIHHAAQLGISNRENAAAHKPIQRKERNDYVYGKGNSRSNPGRLQISA